MSSWSLSSTSTDLKSCIANSNCYYLIKYKECYQNRALHFLFFCCLTLGRGGWGWGWSGLPGSLIGWLIAYQALCVSYMWCEAGWRGERRRIGGRLLGQGAGAAGHSLFGLGGDAHQTVRFENADQAERRAAVGDEVDLVSVWAQELRDLTRRFGPEWHTQRGQGEDSENQSKTQSQHWGHYQSFTQSSLQGPTDGEWNKDKHGKGRRIKWGSGVLTVFPRWRPWHAHNPQEAHVWTCSCC